MIGKLTSVEKGPERNVRLVITPSGVFSEISEPLVTYDPHTIDHYEITGLQQDDRGIVALSFVMADRHKVLFYSTEQKIDMALLLDQLDATIGERRRVDPRESVRPTMRTFIRNHYLPLWLHRIACGFFTALMLALGGMGLLGQADGSWRHLIALCLIGLSVPAGILCACMAHRFSIAEGLAGDVGYEDLDEKQDDKPKPSA